MKKTVMTWPLEIPLVGALAALVVGMAWLPPVSAAWFVLLCLAVCFVIGAARNMEHTTFSDGFFGDPPSPKPVDVDVDQLQERHPDPWESQRQLMYISNQPIGDLERPAITSTVLLYYALILEELGEGFLTLHRVMAPHRLGQHVDLDSGTAVPWDSVGHQLIDHSVSMRAAVANLAGLGNIHVPLTLDQAAAVLDDLTDINVVTCGACVAAGLPGAEAYAEVSSSNLSKANPTTGMIDKDPGGKWIKGANYRAPNLAKVIGANYSGTGE